MSWESTLPYYRRINELVHERLGGLHSARIVMLSVDFLVLATNTMHKVAPAIESAITIPLLHIADVTGAAIAGQSIGTVGLLGTKFTMAEEFYRTRLAERFGLTVLVPDAAQREIVNRTIYEELCCGVIAESSRAAFREIIASLVERSAGGIVLGCTEIPLLVSAADSSVPLFDTGELHARAAVERALAEG